jgi:glycosyltransferase involved in cell wall biosynthesis/thymidylate kinase
MERRFDMLSVYDKAELGMYIYRTDIPMVLSEQEVRYPRSVDWRGWSKSNWLVWALRELDWRRWRQYQRNVWRRFDRIQVFTPYDAQAIRTLAPEVADRVRINPFGIEMPAEADPTLEEPETLAFVGSFGHAPNVEAALWLGNEIMPLLRVRRPGVRLLIVGSMPPPEVRALAGPDIVVTGRVPEVEPFLELAAVVLAPVRSGGGQRTKVLQGMAMGKAVVTTSLGAQGLELAGDPPPVMIGENAEQIAAATLQLLDSPTARRDLGKRARAVVAEHYRPAAFARRIEAIYTELQVDQKHAGHDRPDVRMARRPRRGLSVALLGPDGAGKSTLVEGIRRTFSLPVRSVYMGLWPKSASSGRGLPLPGLSLAGMLLKVWRRYLVGLYHRLMGRLVIFDRYTYDALLTPSNLLGWRGRLYYGAIGHACPAPDLVILLDVPGSVMYERKGEHSPEELEEQRQRFLALAKHLPRLQVVDAARPEEVVRDEVVESIRRAYEQRERSGGSFVVSGVLWVSSLLFGRARRAVPAEGGNGRGRTAAS